MIVGATMIAHPSPIGSGRGTGPEVSMIARQRPWSKGGTDTTAAEGRR